MITSWTIIMRKLRINPGAVCRQLITNLKTHKPLTASEERRILDAIDRCGVPDGTDRMLAKLSRNTLEKLLGNI
jgi:hypothetical protein